MAQPSGHLSLQTIAMPADANWSGNIFGGWLISQMDIAGAIFCERFSRGRCATIAIENMTFLVPVAIGDVVSCYVDLVNVGNTSMHIHIEVWRSSHDHYESTRVTDGHFTFVALNEDGSKRTIPAESKQAFSDGFVSKQLGIGL